MMFPEIFFFFNYSEYAIQKVYFFVFLSSLFIITISYLFQIMYHEVDRESFFKSRADTFHVFIVLLALPYVASY